MSLVVVLDLRRLYNHTHKYELLFHTYSIGDASQAGGQNGSTASTNCGGNDHNLPRYAQPQASTMSSYRIAAPPRRTTPEKRRVEEQTAHLIIRYIRYPRYLMWCTPAHQEMQIVDGVIVQRVAYMRAALQRDPRLPAWVNLSGMNVVYTYLVST